MERRPHIVTEGQVGDIRWARTGGLLATQTPQGTCLSTATDMICALNNGITSYRQLNGPLTLGTGSTAIQAEAVYVHVDAQAVRNAAAGVMRHERQNELAASLFESARGEVARNGYATVQVQEDFVIREMDRVRWAIENPGEAARAAQEDIANALRGIQRQLGGGRDR